MNAASLFVDTAPESHAAPPDAIAARPKTLPVFVFHFSGETDAVREFTDLVESVCSALFVDPSAIHSTSRSKHVAMARHALIWLCRERWGLSYPELGQLFGRDHTTAISSVNRVEEALAGAARLARLAEVVRRHRRGPVLVVPGQGVVLELGGELNV